MIRAHEFDLRLELLNTLLITPHRQLTALAPIHRNLCATDPRFYVRLASWYFDKGEVRDHKEMFVTTLVLSAFDGHRDVGLALLRRLPPYQVTRVVDFIHGRTICRRVRKHHEVQTIEESIGLFQSAPRSLRTEILRYLREREADAAWFDRTVLTARKALKRLYALLHIKPSPRAQQVLFDENPPPDSTLFALKQLAKATSPDEQAEAIVALRIPYKIAASVVKDLTPPVVRALVEVMTPMELINSVSALKKRGALDDPLIQQLVESKLTQAKRDDRVSAFKAEMAIEAADVSDELAQSLREVTQARVQARGRITRSTAMLLDRSGSMTIALEVGKRLGAMISTASQAPLFAYVFDTQAQMLTPADESLASWEKALAGIGPGGGTSIGCVLEALRQAKQRVEQIVLVTDEEENTAPFFQEAYDRYVQELNVPPSVLLLRVGQATNKIEKVCKQKGIPVSVFRFDGDYYALPNVLPLLSQPSQSDLLLEILDYPLPRRRSS